MSELTDTVESLEPRRQDDLISETEDLRRALPGVPIFEIPRWERNGDD